MAFNIKINIFNCAFTIFPFFICLTTCEDTILNINLKKPVAVVSEKFLSITLDPVVLFNSESLNDIQKTTNMAKALAPAYVRIGGPRSNSYIFERSLYPQQIHSEPGYVFSEAQWVQIHQWAEKSGLDIIASITPLQFESNINGNSARSSFWDPRNALDLISFSDHMGYNTSWQLGYECQTRCDVNGSELGRDVQRLRNMLDAFPRYAERGLIIGPDVVTYKTKQQQQYLQDYFNAAANSLSAVTWHPDFASISLETEGVSMHYDNLIFDKDSFYRAIGRQLLKKPLWIAESKPEECKQQFLGALVWARRLGNSAKLGFQILMRQPANSNLFRPTPDYWVSVLHKMLVGREVLDTKITMGNRTHLHFYCQCTNPSSKYEKGSLTVFGINLTPSKIIASVKGIKPKVVHKYILMPGYDAPNRMFAETVLLNNEPLNLIGGKELPDVQPIISTAEKGVKLKLPSGGIGFWVLPGLKIKSCMTQDDEITDKNLQKKMSRRIGESEINVVTETEDDNNRENTETNNSVEERKSPLRLQRTAQKRLLLRRNIRHKEDDRDDSDDRKSRKLDGARRDFDRLERIMRRRDQHSVNLKSGGTHSVFESSDEDHNGSSEEGVFSMIINGKKLDSGEVIHTKLQEYKKRLMNYENKKKQRESISNLPKERNKDEADTSVNKGMDTEKVIEALTLITKVESALKGLNGSEVQITSEAQTLGTSDFNDVTAGLQRSSNVSHRGEDVLLDEVLNTEKSKRTSVPTRIEDQLKALYRLLSEEKERRDNQLSQRQKREFDKRLVDDPLGLRLGNIFLHKRMKTEVAKERLKERVNERKQRLRERHDLKREKEETKKEYRDSNENNFYGFQSREPLKHFPTGDIYFQTENDKNDRTNVDYKYVDDIDEDDVYNLQSRRNWKRSNARGSIDDLEDTGIKEKQTGYIPTEFYENTNPESLNKKDKLKEPEELWKAESIHKIKQNEKNNNEPAEFINYDIVTENSLPKLENGKIKEKAIQELLNDKNYNFDHSDQNQQKIQYQPQTSSSTITPNYQENLTSTNSDEFQIEQRNKYIDVYKYHINPTANIQNGKSLYPRLKRYTYNLEDLLRQEMITQDDNNLRDCQCRVIRGIEECKDCGMDEKNILQTQLIVMSDEDIENHTNNHIRKNRFRRDLNRKTNISYEEKPIDSISQDQKVKTTNFKRQIELEVNKATNIENHKKKETVEFTTIKVDDQLKLENANDKTLWNRLPRKIESSTKFIYKTVEAPPIIKGNLQNDQQRTTTATNDFTSSNIYFNNNETKSQIEHVINIRSSDTATSQQSLESPIEKNSDKTTSSNVKDEVNEEKDIGNTSDSQTTVATITNAQKIDDKSSKAISKNINETNTDVKSKPNNNSTTKIDERLKSRQARLAIRAEALAALRKENESRRTKKMIEASMKRMDMEKSKFDEYQKRRQDQVERLKRKLRAKREKILQEYRTELIEAINGSSETKESNVHERDLLDKLQATINVSEKKDLITQTDKFGFAVSHKPIKYSMVKDMYALTNEKGIPEFELKEPYHEINRRQILSKNQYKINVNNDNKYEINKDKKQIKKLEKTLTNEDFYNTRNEQEFQMKNQRSFNVIDTNAPVKNQNLQKFNNPKETDDEYYVQRQSNQYISKEQQQQKIEYNPRIKHNKENILPLHMQYSQQPLYTQAHADIYKIKPSYIQEKSNKYSEKIDTMNTQPINSSKFYHTNDKNIQGTFTVNDYYETNDQNIRNQKQLKENINQLSRPDYNEFRKEPLEQNYQKPKRLNLKFFEINSSINNDNESNLKTEKLRMLMRPYSQVIIKNYKNPQRDISTRYKREAVPNKEDFYEPLSFSLGLEKSKMKQKEIENTAFSDKLIRKKRLANGIDKKDKIPLKNISSFHNYIKKYYGKYFDKNYRKLQKRSRYTEVMKNILTLPTNSPNTYIYNNSINFNHIPKEVKRLNNNNIVREINSLDFPVKKKRSFDQKNYQILESNGIDDVENSEVNDIFNSKIETKQDEKLLQNNHIIKDSTENQYNNKDYVNPIVHSLSNKKNLTILKTTEATTETHVKSILTEAIPKLDTAIPEGLKEAENLTDSIEYFVDNFDDQLNNSAKYLNENTKNIDTSEKNNENLNHSIVKTVVGSVKKLFDLISGITQIFHG